MWLSLQLLAWQMVSFTDCASNELYWKWSRGCGLWIITVDSLCPLCLAFSVAKQSGETTNKIFITQISLP